MPLIRVFALGGSVLAPDRPDVGYAEAFATIVGERIALGERALVVTGGGGVARQYIRAARALGVDEDTLDLLGIDATRLNARFLAAVLRARLGPDVAVDVPHDVATTAARLARHPVAVMGGTLPGHSTDHVAATLASAAGADHLYVLTNVDGVYTADPRLDQTARLLPELSTADLVRLAGNGWVAGKTGVVDPSCARHVHEQRLPITVMDGRDLAGLRDVLAGRRRVGSLVRPA